MEKQPPEIDTRPTPMPVDELEQLGEEITELSAHLEAATARLLHLIREFDAQGGWTMIRHDDPGLRRRGQLPVARPRASVETEGGRV